VIATILGLGVLATARRAAQSELASRPRHEPETTKSLQMVPRALARRRVVSNPKRFRCNASSFIR
jgi:hypothetical protein